MYHNMLVRHVGQWEPESKAKVEIRRTSRRKSKLTKLQNENNLNVPFTKNRGKALNILKALEKLGTQITFKESYPDLYNFL